MYNFKNVVRDADNKWDGGKEQLCAKLRKILEPLPGLTTRSGRSGPSKGSASATSPIAGRADAVTQRGYAIYKYSTTVCVFWRRIRICRVLIFVNSQHQHIAYATTMEGAVVLKCINNARANEIKLLEFLHRTLTPDNHTIPFTIILSTQSDTVISMPYQEPLNECSTLSVHMAANFGRQLLEAVRFMHVQGVAHRDLKPENVVVDLGMHQLFIIDYDLAIFVDGRDDMVHGYVGTDGFTAPEVGDDWKERYYSPIAADLWATGRVLEFLLSRSNDPESPELKPLWSISRLLLNDDPAQRPGADRALARLPKNATSAMPRLAEASSPAAIRGASKRGSRRSDWLKMARPPTRVC